MTSAAVKAKRSRMARILVFSVALVSFFVILNVPAASADTITYAFTGVGTFAGTSFSVVSSAYITAPPPDFSLSPEAGAVVDYAPSGPPTTAGTLISINGMTGEIDLITSLDGTLAFSIGHEVYPTAPVTDYAIHVNGVQTGEVTVTDVPTSTPEPGVRSLMLMGLMSLGLVLAMRKRAVLGLPKAT
jgi:hypothetical protein